jgi:hypothetical protein
MHGTDIKLILTVFGLGVWVQLAEDKAEWRTL